MKETYTPTELAKRWSMTYQNIFNLINARKIEAFKVGNSWRIKSSEVARIEGQTNTKGESGIGE